MIPMRQSGAAEQNAMLQPQPAAGGPPPGAAAAAAPPGTGRRRRPQGNQAWLREVRREHKLGEPGDVVLIGGTSVADFRVRIAQAHARHDLTPSYWSLVGLIRDRDELLTATLEGWEDAAAIPATNAIVTLPLARFDDPERYPNIAVLRFPGSSPDVLHAADRLKTQRSTADLPALVVDWLGFVWGTEGSRNPLLEGSGLPSAVLVELAFGLIDVEVTPGLASASSCPEAIWQSAKWWQDFYAQTAPRTADGKARAGGTTPWGRYLTRQTQATYVDPAG
jgi:hypothetical protein